MCAGPRERKAVRLDRCALCLSRRSGGSLAGGGFRQASRNNSPRNRFAFITKLSNPASAYQKRIPKCAAVVAVSRALADCARTLAPAGCRIEVLRNGVDLESLSRNRSGDKTRRELNLTGPTLICVGISFPEKVMNWSSRHSRSFRRRSC